MIQLVFYYQQKERNNRRLNEFVLNYPEESPHQKLVREPCDTLNNHHLMRTRL